MLSKRIRALPASLAATGALVATTLFAFSGGAFAAPPPGGPAGGPPGGPPGLRHCGTIDYHHMQFPNEACLRLRFHAMGVVEMVQTGAPGALVLRLSDGRLLALNLESNVMVRNDQGAAASLADVTTGDTVVAPYSVTSRGDVTREIEYLAPGTTPPAQSTPPSPPFRVRGRIVSDTNGALVVDTARGVQEDLTITAQSHVTARTSGSLAAGDFFIGEAQKVGTANDVMNLVYGTMPFWESRHLFTGTLTAGSGTQGTLSAGGHTYDVTLVHNAVVMDANGASASLTAGQRVRVRGSLFLNTLYASYVLVTGQGPVAPGN